MREREREREREFMLSEVYEPLKESKIIHLMQFEWK